MEDNESLLGKLRALLHKHKDEENTDEEILSIVNDYKNQGALEEDEVEMISNIMEFSDTQAKDIMTHRSRMDAISKDTTMEKALHHMLHCNYTRYPLYDTTNDNIIGILYLKDVMLSFMEVTWYETCSCRSDDPCSDRNNAGSGGKSAGKRYRSRSDGRNPTGRG